MGKLITVSDRNLRESGQSPPSLTYSITATDITAVKTRGRSKKLLIKEIQLTCACSGDYSAGNTFVGQGNGTIKANSPRVKCQGELLLLEGDNVTIECTGTIKNTQSGATSPGKAFITITIANQTNIRVYVNDR